MVKNKKERELHQAKEREFMSLKTVEIDELQSVKTSNNIPSERRHERDIYRAGTANKWYEAALKQEAE